MRKSTTTVTRRWFLLIITLLAETAMAGRAWAANIAPVGIALLGVNDAIDSGAGTPHLNAGVAANINDHDLTTRVDNRFGHGMTDQGQAMSFVGIVWLAPRYDEIKILELTLALFDDGGWFGPQGLGPAPGEALTAAHLIDPTTQISTNQGVTWTTVPHMSNYLTVMTGHAIGGGTNENPTTATVAFRLQTPATQVNGVRIIGENGGTGDGNGFIGVFELVVLATPLADTDGDGMPDAWEEAHGLNVAANDAAIDADGDGATNLEEYTAGTDPQRADTDGDGLSDGAEIKTYHTNPLLADTDGDGLNDGVEVINLRTNPLAADTDGDGFADGLEVAQGSDPLSKDSVPNNLALSGHGLMGTKESLTSGPETEQELYHAGAPENIVDGNLTTRVDTDNGDSPGNVSFVGILWDQPLTKPIVRLDLSLAIFFDGGWFGVSGIGPGSGGTLSATEHLVEPQVQISQDRGATWTTVAHSSDYLQALNGHPLPTVDFGPPTLAEATFQLIPPQVGINGIRILGPEGGSGSGGFLGVFELAALTSEPNPGTELTIENAVRASDKIQFQLATKAGTNYTLQFTTSLQNPNWQTLTTIAGDGTRKTVTDHLTDRQRFYRVILAVRTAQL